MRKPSSETDLVDLAKERTESQRDNSNLALLVKNWK